MASVSPPSPVRTTEKRSASFGSSLQSIIARELSVDEDSLLIYYGRLFVSETRIGKDTGTKYRSVVISFRDDKGEDCQVEKIYYEGQIRHVDEIFTPFQERRVLFAAADIDTEHVKVHLHKSGKRNIYTYKAEDLFLLSLNAVKQQQVLQKPEPAPIPAPIPQKEEQPPADWDAELPDETLPEEPMKEEEPPSPAPSPSPSIMTPAQLAKEQQLYWRCVSDAIPNVEERHIFLELHGLSHDFQRWTEPQLPPIDTLLQRWFNVISPEHPLGHDNWDQPVTKEQQKAIVALARHWPTKEEGIDFIKALIAKRGRTLLQEMNQGTLECLRMAILASLPSPKA